MPWHTCDKFYFVQIKNTMRLLQAHTGFADADISTDYYRNMLFIANVTSFGSGGKNFIMYAYL